MYQLAVFLHVLATATWVGGMLFIAIVLVPLSRKMQAPPGAGAVMLSGAARRFRPLGWGSLAVLVLTGIWLLLDRGASIGKLISEDSAFFQAMRLKLGLVALLLALTALHDFVLGPRLSRNLQRRGGEQPHPNRGGRERRLVSWLARFNLLVTLAIVALGVVLVRGWPA